jgi:predicted HTH domain antitoxin
MSITVTLEIPDGLDLNEHALKMILAIQLYESGKCSLGQSAMIAGISKKSFVETMGIFGGSVLSGYTKEDLHHDLKYA